VHENCVASAADDNVSIEPMKNKKDCLFFIFAAILFFFHVNITSKTFMTLKL
jgi:hypothetical protein